MPSFRRLARPGLKIAAHVWNRIAEEIRNGALMEQTEVKRPIHRMIKVQKAGNPRTTSLAPVVLAARAAILATVVLYEPSMDLIARGRNGVDTCLV